MAVSALSLIGCGGGAGATDAGTTSKAGGGATTLTISEYEYSPAEIAVPAGTVLKITNEDSTPHTVTSKQSGAFDSGSIDAGKRGQVELEKPGTYAYYCAFHPFMKGTIEVEPG